MSGYSITVKVDSTGVGHTFVQLSAPGEPTITRGFYPANPGFPSDNGRVKDDASPATGGEHVSDWSSGSISITEQQYNAMVGEILRIHLETTRPGDPLQYNFSSTNCTWIVRTILKAGGVKGFEGWNPSPKSLIPIPAWDPFYLELNQLYDKSMLAGSIRGRRAGWREIITPIIFDLDGDGVETKSLSDDVLFDHDGNGLSERSGWVGPDDGLLTWDRNGNGTIDDGSELFGNYTPISGGNKAANGYEALAFLDSNSDGKIDASDTAWSQLRIWKDIDGSAYSSQGELMSLSTAGIQSLDTSYVISSNVDPQGNEHRQVSTFTKTDGSLGTTTDVWFQRDTSTTYAKSWLDESPEIAALPDLTASGNMYDLHQAMVRDSTGSLKTLVGQFGLTPNKSVRYSLLEQILFKWAGVDGIDPASRGDPWARP